jgi:hypothetical protein
VEDSQAECHTGWLIRLYAQCVQAQKQDRGKRIGRFELIAEGQASNPQLRFDYIPQECCFEANLGRRAWFRPINLNPEDADVL